MFPLPTRHALRLKVATRIALSSNYKFSSTRSVYSRGRRLVPRLGRIGLASGVVLGGSLLVATHVADDMDSTIRDANRPPDRKPVPLTTLLRSYIVYTMCSVPALVDWSPTILSTLMTIPIIRDVTAAFVRVTFFAQFVGGDTAHDVIPLLEQLRAENKGVLFAYSVEVHETEASGKALKQGDQPIQSAHMQPTHKKIVDEMIRSIDVAADFEDKHGHGNVAGRRTWVAVKMTALLPDSHSLVNLSSHLINTRPALHSPVAFPGRARSTDLDILRSKSIPTSSPLTQSDIAALEDLNSDLIKICARAKERGVKIIVDAEYSWYQPAIDAFTLSLSREFNKLPSGNSPAANYVQPLVYGTYQAYLRRTPELLAQSLEDAKANNYSLGVKLVRGAYHTHETAAHRHTDPIRTDPTTESHSLSISPETHPPVWSEKASTDKCYNACARLLISEIKTDIDRKSNWTRAPSTPRLGVLFGTHNWESCDMVLKELVDHGLAVRDEDGGKDVISIGTDVTERLAIGQLFGMSDALTNSLVNRTKSLSPFVIKYVPYGALKDVMPYLSRRAIENKSVLGNGAATQERKLAGAAIKNRMLHRTVGPV